MKITPCLVLSALLISPLLPAASLGDSINESRQREAEEASRTVLSKGTVNGLEYRVFDAILSKTLLLPDAMRRGKAITPNNEGSVVMFVRGEIVNVCSEARNVKMPKFISASGNVYDPQALYLKSQKAQMFEKLNPKEKSQLILCFIVPVTEIIGGKLQCKDGELFSEAPTAYLPLPFDNDTTINETNTVYDVTNNMFDTND